MSDIFCQIIEGKIPSTKIYEDEQVLAILDISQATYGHCLVMPKKHYTDVLHISEEELASLMIRVQRVAKRILEKLGTKDCNIITNCGELSGQSIPHLHFHILPRYLDDDLRIEYKNHSYSLQEIAEKIK